MAGTGSEPCDAGVVDYVDTVGLLQEEIARLEAELRLRDEAATAAPPPPDAGPDADALAARMAEHAAEIAERDRTIELLWEQIVLLEEAEAAGKAEYDQIHRWVEELERRVEAGGDPSFADPAELDATRGEAERLRQELESERRAGESRRKTLEEEVAVLRSRLEEAARGGSDAEARAGLERENRTLRQQCRRLAEAEALAANAGAMRDQLQEARAELSVARTQLAEAGDTLERERTEKEAELVALRAELARTRLAANTPARDLDMDQRMHAFRAHLKELHEREEQERQERSLSSRLSRLWRRTGPAR